MDYFKHLYLIKDFSTGLFRFDEGQPYLEPLETVVASGMFFTSSARLDHLQALVQEYAVDSTWFNFNDETERYISGIVQGII